MEKTSHDCSSTVVGVLRLGGERLDALLLGCFDSEDGSAYVES